MVMIDVYKKFKCPICFVSLNTAEFVKYLSNSFLATLISFSNEMSIIADAIGGIDTAESFRIAHLDRRWNENGMASYMYPGCGYGGYCLPKDTKALLAGAGAAGVDAGILKNVIKTNDAMPLVMAERIEKAAGYDKSRIIGVLGLSFKPGSDDVRDSASARIIQRLLADGYDLVSAYDPVANAPFAACYSGLKLDYRDSLEGLIESADVLAILTAWDDFRALRGMTGKPIVDCRYML
jgi:UDPglucose 6-dehydrogenase